MDGLVTLVIDPKQGAISTMTWQRAVALHEATEQRREAAARGEILKLLDDVTKKPLPYIHVQAYYEKTIRSAHREHLIPAVVRLEKPTHKPPTPAKYAFLGIYERDGRRCQYCGEMVPYSKAQQEHVIPRSQGGKRTWENIVAACEECNIRKGPRTPEQAGMPLLSQPSRPVGTQILYYPGMPEEWKAHIFPAKKMAR